MEFYPFEKCALGSGFYWATLKDRAGGQARGADQMQHGLPEPKCNLVCSHFFWKSTLQGMEITRGPSG